MRIGKAFGLKNMGMTNREHTSKQKWDCLPESEKESRISKLKGFSPVLRDLESKGYIYPKITKQISKPYANPNKTAHSPPNIEGLGGLCEVEGVRGGFVFKTKLNGGKQNDKKSYGVD